MIFYIIVYVIMAIITYKLSIIKSWIPAILWPIVVSLYLFAKAAVWFEERDNGRS